MERTTIRLGVFWSVLAVGVFLGAGSLFTTPATAGPPAKVVICHIPPGNPSNFHTITISEKALSAHLAHGDLGGPCSQFCADLCDDGDACTIDDTGDCDHGCPPLAPVDCDDANECTVDSCDPLDGCVNTPEIGKPCDDGAICTGPDACDESGQCVGPPIENCCIDDSACSQNPCDQAQCLDNWCVENPVMCYPPDLCTVSECAPDTGECVDSPVVCPEGETCNPSTGQCEIDCKVIDFEEFTPHDQGKRFGVELSRYYEGFDWAYDDAWKICTPANPTTCWGSWAVNDVASDGVSGAGGGDNWIKARTRWEGKGAKITSPDVNGFIFKSMMLMTRDPAQYPFLTEVTVTWRPVTGSDVSVVVDLDAAGFDTWFEVTAADLGIPASTPLKSMWFTAPGVTNANAGKFGLDDFTVLD